MKPAITVRQADKRLIVHIGISFVKAEDQGAAMVGPENRPLPKNKRPVVNASHDENASQNEKAPPHFT